MINIRKQLSQVREYVKQVIVGRDDLIDVILYALVTKNHVFVYGPPGVAKTLTAHEVFKFLEGRIFTVQCSKRMSEDYVIGPPDMKKFKDEGSIEHIVDGYMPTADYAIVDEALDAPDSVLRSMLGILNERRLLKGKQNINCPMRTTLFATNYSPDTEALEAVEDRFLFRLEVGYLSTVEALVGMLDTEPDERPNISLTQGSLNLAYEQVQDVFVPQVFKEAVVNIALMCRKEGITVTDRRIKWAFDALKARAFFERREYVLPCDLEGLAKVFIVSGKDSEEQKFAHIMSKNHHAYFGVDYNNLYSLLYILDRDTEDTFVNKLSTESKKEFEASKKLVIQQIEKLSEALVSEPMPSRYEELVKEEHRKIKGIQNTIKQLEYEQCV